MFAAQLIEDVIICQVLPMNLIQLLSKNLDGIKSIHLNPYVVESWSKDL